MNYTVKYELDTSKTYSYEVRQIIHSEDGKVRAATVPEPIYGYFSFGTAIEIPESSPSKPLSSMVTELLETKIDGAGLLFSPDKVKSTFASIDYTVLTGADNPYRQLILRQDIMKNIGESDGIWHLNKPPTYDGFSYDEVLEFNHG